MLLVLTKLKGLESVPDLMTKDFLKNKKCECEFHFANEQNNQFTSCYVARVGTTLTITENCWTQLSFNMSFLNYGGIPTSISQ